MHSGGVQLFAQRSQPAQSVFFGSRAWLYLVRSPKHSFAAVGAARRGHSRGFQRLNLCLIILTRALCPSLVPRGAKSGSALATFFANGCDSKSIPTCLPAAGQRVRAYTYGPLRRHKINGGSASYITTGSSQHSAADTSRGLGRKMITTDSHH